MTDSHKKFNKTVWRVIVGGKHHLLSGTLFILS